ncbi:MAG: translation initiation factor IF-2 [Lachnospiraceae bacterium]|nr:translation initiation factor IF-2 [Lachnospiraceae bacterium]
MKISELAKDLNITSKEVIKFLQDNGYDYKSPQKNLVAEEEDLVRKNLKVSAKADATEAKPAAKKEEKTEEVAAKAPVKEESAENKAEVAPQKEVKKEANDAAKAEAPKKKKNIIFVGNPQNSKMGGQNAGRPAQRPAQPMQNKKPVSNAGPARPSGLIRPTTPPSAAPAINFVPAGNPNSRPQSAPKKEVAVETAEQNARTVNENRSERPQGNVNRNNGERPQGGFNRDNRGERPQGGFNRDNRGERPQGGFNKDRGERPQGGFNRGEKTQGGFNKDRGQGGFHKDGDDSRGGRREDNRFAKKPQGGRMFGGDTPVVEPEKHRDDEKRRISQEKDKKKKESNYEDGDFKGKGKGKLKPGSFIKPEKKVEEKVEDDIKVITIPDVLTLKDLADKMKLQPSAIVKKLFLKGEILTVNSEISFEKAEEIAIEYDIICEKEIQVDVIEELLKEEEEDEATMTERPPVICVMGHVDHGKTSLLDAIRKTHVTDREAGGITQHIGAYMVQVDDRKITFLDTPGHEAFTAMRMRGANATDIAILVVAADDGVMPQTKEAINHAKAAGVQIIVAVNKVDKIGYDFNDPSRKMDSYPSINNLMRELAEEHELLSEDWGGTTIFAPVSAKMGHGISELLDMILLSADMLELKANAKRQARGLVIEAQLDKGRGPVATILVQKGTLHVGDFISAGASHGKVRAMVDDKGRRVKEATPSTPVEILGLNDVPNAGEIFVCHKNDKEAKSFAETFIAQNKVKLLEDTKAKMSLDDLFSQIQAGNLKELNLIVKADVQGSVEAVKQSLVKLSNEEIAVKVIHGGVGAINESDVILASAAKAIIIGFNVRLDNMAKDTVEKEGVDVRLYSVIYQAIEDVEAAMKGMLDPIYEEKIIGHAEVRQIFKASAIGNIAGSYVLDGMFQRNALVRITREGEQIYEGKLASLKRFKDDVKEVKAGFECGLVFEDFDKMQELDIVEAYIMVEVPR